MKNNCKKILSVLLAALMALSIPITAFAFVFPIMTLTVDNDAKPKLYAGITYKIVATVDNVSSTDLANTPQGSAFTWSTDVSGVTPVSANNYKAEADGNGMYTVSETAQFVMPIAGTSITITASYGSVATKTLTTTSLQPVTDISLKCVNTENVYYNTDTDSIYIDQTLNSNNANETYSANLTTTLSPTINDDTLALTSTLPSDKIKATVSGNNISFFINTGAAETSTLSITPMSGYPFKKTLSVTRCIPLTYFELKATPYNSNSGLVVSNTKDNSTIDDFGGTTVISGDNLTIEPVGKQTKNGNSNDGFKYTLYTDASLTVPTPTSYYSVSNKDNKCVLNIPNSGTYYLVCENVSAGNGCLKRDLVAYTAITVTQSKPIKTINFYELDNNGDMTSTLLTEKTLYTNSSSTYDISKNVSILPSGYTHGISYKSADTSIAQVNASTGVITAIKGGKTSVYAISDDSDNVLAKCDINVIVGVIGITSVNTENSSKTLPAGHKMQLTAVTNPTNAQEKIYWSSSDSSVLSVDNNGLVYANPDYNFNGAESKPVTITAMSEFGKSGSAIIDVIPAVRATNINVDVTSASDSETFKKEGNSYSDYKDKSYNLTYTATDAQGNASNDVFVWKVSVADKTFIDLEDAKDYITINNYDSSTNSYRITSKTTNTIYVYCFAQKLGENFNPGNNYGEAIINSWQKVEGLSFFNPDTNGGITTTLSTGAATKIKVNVSPFGAENQDELTFSEYSSDIISVQNIDANTILVTGLKQGSSKLIVSCKSKNRTQQINFTVTNNIDASIATGVEQAYVYNGNDIKPVPTLIFNGSILNTNAHYNIGYTNCRDVGTATININGKGDFNTSTKKINYQIVPKTMTTSNISIGTINAQTLNDNTRSATPSPSVHDNDRNVNLAKDRDYVLSYVNNTASGTATIYVTGIGNYSGTVSSTFKVIDQANRFVISPIGNCVHTGQAQTPGFYVTYNGVLLTQGVDYKVSYGNNTNVGKANVTVEGINTNDRGGYVGRATANFYIVPSMTASVKASSVTNSSAVVTWANIAGAGGYQIMNSAGSVVATLQGGNTLTTTLSSLPSASKLQYYVRAYVLIDNVAYYGQARGFSFTTKCKTPSISLKTKSKSVTAKWKKVSNISGYQIQCSTSSKYKKAKTYTVKKSATSKTFKKLKKGKKYYVRIRSYKTVNGKKVYSSWKSKSIKCK